MKITRKNGVGLFFIFCFIFLCVFLLGCFFLFLFFCCFCLLYFCCCFILLCNLYLNFNLRLLKKKSEFKKKKNLQYWSLFFIKLQAFFYRTPTVAAIGFSWQQILFQLNLVIIAESRTAIVPETRVSLRSSHWSCSVIKRILRNFANFTENTCIEVSLK